MCRDVELETISTTTNELPSTSHNYSTDDAGENVGGRRNSMTADGVSLNFFRENIIFCNMFTVLLRDAPKVKDTPERNTFCQKRDCLASPTKPKSSLRKTNSYRKILTA